MSVMSVPTCDPGSRGAPQVLERIPPHALLDLSRLATLREVARRGSYSAAAESLHFTPSAVSQQMTCLSRDLGFLLFDRTPRGMRLTTAAEILVTHIDVVFARLNDAQTHLDEAAGGVRGRLRVGSFPTATVEFLAETLGELQDRFPAVKVSLADGEPYESITRLRERALDLAVVFDFDHRPLSADYEGRAICTDSEVECVDLFDDPFVVVLPRDHQLAGYERLEIAQLAGERVLSGPPGSSPWATDFQALCREAAFEPNLETSFRSLNFAALQAVVATGRGVTLAPDLARLPEHPGVVIRPIENGPVRHVRIATLAGAPATLAMTAMVELLRATTASLMAPPQPLVAVVG